jgi:hypothetical protein
MDFPSGRQASPLCGEICGEYLHEWVGLRWTSDALKGLFLLLAYFALDKTVSS